MEGIRDADGNNQALLVLPGHGSQPAPDGPVWRKTFNRYTSSRLSYQFGRTEDLQICHSGTLFRASQFLSEELPIRLAHRVQELGDLPDGLNEIPSIKKVQDWYAQSFEVYSASNSGGCSRIRLGADPHVGFNDNPTA